MGVGSSRKKKSKASKASFTELLNDLFLNICDLLPDLKVKNTEHNNARNHALSIFAFYRTYKNSSDEEAVKIAYGDIKTDNSADNIANDITALTSLLDFVEGKTPKKRVTVFTTELQVLVGNAREVVNALNKVIDEVIPNRQEISDTLKAAITTREDSATGAPRIRRGKKRDQGNRRRKAGTTTTSPERSKGGGGRTHGKR